ncbi:MAG: transcription termination/antitermination NusG family protein [Prevotella sp.]
MDNKYSWFVAVVTPNTEVKCMDKLKKLAAVLSDNKIIDSAEEVTSYVPTQNVLRIQPSTGRRVQVKHVLTPCYLFIRCTDSTRYQLACIAPFILHFLMNRAKKTNSGKSDYARIPDVQMENFMRMVEEAEKAVIIDPNRVHLGDKVRIKTGRLAGLEGNICKEPDGSTTLALRVDFLGYAKMQCPTDILELVKQ